MTRTIRGRNSFDLSYCAWVLGAALAATAGCGGDDKKASTCAPGDETCACYGNHTCNGSLTCASNVCVNLNAGGGSSVGGGATAINTSSNTSATSVSQQGGSTAVAVSSSGGSNTTGGVANAGGASLGGATTNNGGNGTTNGGASPLGGAVNTGGTNVGGLVSQGGSNTAAGDTAAGGANPAGGQLATGGVNTPGGSGSLIVGTTAPGGQVSTGGVPNVGGASAGVGGSTGGTPPTTGGAPPNTCGNGTVEGTEGCDPAVHDNNFADGCTPLCKVEPDCPAIGGGCTTRCGDGFVLDAEKCDDGNTVSGDGCSSTCEIEPDFDCVQPEPGDSIIVPMVVRDFNKGGDFEKDFVGLEYANQGLLKPALNDHGKPELAFTTGTYYGVAGRTSGIASAESFARWYDDAATSTVNTYHATMATTLKLYQVAPGVYVNRYGANGEPWIRESLAAANWCGSVGSEVLDADGKPIPCTYCPGDNLNTPECDYPFAIPCDDRTNFLRCEVSGSSYHGIYAEAILDGTPVFFPADGMTPANPSSSAKLPPYYAGYWIDEPNTPKHNFSFTTEVRFWFKYDASKTLKLDFIGDDDAWVFINKKLALDVGGIHTPIEGYLSVATDGTAKASVSTTDPSYTRDTVTTNVSLGLEDGKLYEVAVFQAERQTTASSYLLSFSGFNTAPSVCTHK